MGKGAHSLGYLLHRCKEGNGEMAGGRGRKDGRLLWQQRQLHEQSKETNEGTGSMGAGGGQRRVGRCSGDQSEMPSGKAAPWTKKRKS